jgi:hypothetical protein
MFQLIINTYTYYIKIIWELRRQCLRNLIAHKITPNPSYSSSCTSPAFDNNSENGSGF